VQLKGFVEQISLRIWCESMKKWENKWKSFCSLTIH